MTVIADSAQFSAAVSELAPPGTAGSALSLQTAVGFVFTSITIVLVGLLAPADGGGWGLAFGLLALGPVAGSLAMWRLRARPGGDAHGQRPPMSALGRRPRPSAPPTSWRRGGASRPSSSWRSGARSDGGPRRVSAPRIAAQLAVLAEAMATLVDGFDEADLRGPGGEGDWNVAQCVGHAADSRAGLALAAAKAASGTFPPDAPQVVPGIPGSAAADAARRCASAWPPSQRIVERAAGTVAGHELDPCPLVHPLVGRLRCGEWLLFAGVHDLMHLEQLHGLAASPTMAS